LHRARSNDNMDIALDVKIDNPSVKIAPLIFMAFVENAFKYSTRDNTQNTIRINLRQQADRIIFECANSYEETAQPAGGIGLNNVMRRLELLYKDHYTLNITKEQNIYRVKLILAV